MNRPAAVLFDLDDTLIDRIETARVYADGFRRDFGYGLATADPAAVFTAIVRADGRGYRPKPEGCQELHDVLPWRDAPSPAELLAHWQEHFPACSQLRPGARETLHALQSGGHPLALVTNGSTVGQSRKIDGLGLRDYFRAVVISEAFGEKKPGRAIFHHATAQLERTPAGAWFIGDHPINDIVGAAGAGLRPIWLRGVHPWPSAHPMPRHQVDQLPEIRAVIDRSESRA